MPVVPNGLTKRPHERERLKDSVSGIYAPPYSFTFPGALEGVGYDEFPKSPTI